MQDHDQGREICPCDFQGINLQDRNALLSPMVVNYTKAKFGIKKKKPHVRLLNGEISFQFNKTASNQTLMVSLLAGTRHDVLASIWVNDMPLTLLDHHHTTYWMHSNSTHVPLPDIDGNVFDVTIRREHGDVRLMYLSVISFPQQ